MQFEKFKAQWKGQEHFSVSRFLGRLRYPRALAALFPSARRY